MFDRGCLWPCQGRSFSRNKFLVQEIWFEKSGWPEKKMVLYHKSTFFLVREKWLTRKKIRVWRTTFLEPLFYTFSESRSQNKRSSALWINAALQLLSVTGGGGNFWVFWPRSSPLLLTWVSFVYQSTIAKARCIAYSSSTKRRYRALIGTPTPSWNVNWGFKNSFFFYRISHKNC